MRNGTLNYTDEEITALANNDLFLATESLLSSNNKNNADFLLPLPNHEIAAADVLNNGEVDPNVREHYTKNVDCLNPDQRTTHETLKDRIDQNLGCLCNIDAPGGTGKIFLHNLLLVHVRKENNIAIATAMSEIAAVLMFLGSTAHKRFSFPILCHEDSSCNINLQSEQANIIKNLKITFINECSMTLCKQLDCLDRFLKELMNSSLPMGGKLVVLMGDFRQTLPVVEGG